MKANLTFFQNAYLYRNLILQMTRREIYQRYRGSILGFFWTFLNPLLMLSVYTFIFSVVFKSRWGDSTNQESQIDFAITLFAGMIMYYMFAEIINQAPSLILGNVNYVKKLIFPIEFLPLISTGNVLFHSSVSILVLLTAQLVFKGFIPITIIFLPVVLIPLLLIGLGLSWFLSALTVYIRDISQIVPVLTTILMFMSAVFFPVSAIPKEYQFIILSNPIAVIISESRKILIFGELPDWVLLGWVFIVGLLLATGGYLWFQKTKKGFADVL